MHSAANYTLMPSQNKLNPSEVHKIGKTQHPKTSFDGLKKLSSTMSIAALATLGLAGTFSTEAAQANENTPSAESKENQEPISIEEVQTQLYQALKGETEKHPEISQSFLQLINSLRNDKALKPYTNEFILQLDKALHVKDMPAHAAFLQRELYSKLIIERDHELEKDSAAESYRVYVLTTDMPVTFTAVINRKEVFINNKKFTDIVGDLGDTLTDKIEFTGIQVSK